VGDGRVFVGPKNADLTIVKKMEGVLQAAACVPMFAGGTPALH